MQSKATFQMVAIAKRIADKNGISVDAVLDRFSRSVKKSAFSMSDFFWAGSNISLGVAKNSSAVRRTALAAR